MFRRIMKLRAQPVVQKQCLHLAFHEILLSNQMRVCDPVISTSVYHNKIRNGFVQDQSRRTFTFLRQLHLKRSYLNSLCLIRKLCDYNTTVGHLWSFVVLLSPIRCRKTTTNKKQPGKNQGKACTSKSYIPQPTAHVFGSYHKLQRHEHVFLLGGLNVG